MAVRSRAGVSSNEGRGLRAPTPYPTLHSPGEGVDVPAVGEAPPTPVFRTPSARAPRAPCSPPSGITPPP
eukprot:scaffold35852_cov112-Isochrysis_galbana.AAC.2